MYTTLPAFTILWLTADVCEDLIAIQPREPLPLVSVQLNTCQQHVLSEDCWTDACISVLHYRPTSAYTTTKKSSKSVELLVINLNEL